MLTVQQSNVSPVIASLSKAASLIHAPPMLTHADEVDVWSFDVTPRFAPETPRSVAAPELRGDREFMLAAAETFREGDVLRYDIDALGAQLAEEEISSSPSVIGDLNGALEPPHLAVPWGEAAALAVQQSKAASLAVPLSKAASIIHASPMLTTNADTVDFCSSVVMSGLAPETPRVKAYPPPWRKQPRPRREPGWPHPASPQQEGRPLRSWIQRRQRRHRLSWPWRPLKRAGLRRWKWSPQNFAGTASSSTRPSRSAPLPRCCPSLLGLSAACYLESAPLCSRLWRRPGRRCLLRRRRHCVPISASCWRLRPGPPRRSCATPPGSCRRSSSSEGGVRTGPSAAQFRMILIRDFRSISYSSRT